MKPYILGAIFARGGSKGIPRKNIRLLGKKPLIAYAIAIGRAVSMIDRLIVSTDDKEIAKVARLYGAEVPFMRPKHLATDRSSEILSWKHALDMIEKESGRRVDVFVSIPPTSPLRSAQDVEKCIKELLRSRADIVVTVKKSERNPYFNMVTLDTKGYARLAMAGKNTVTHRQQAPKVFDMTTVAYAARASFVRRASSILEGRVKAVIVPAERALDIDTPLDFKIAEFLINRGMKKR